MTEFLSDQTDAEEGVVTELPEEEELEGFGTGEDPDGKPLEEGADLF